MTATPTLQRPQGRARHMLSGGWDPSEYTYVGEFDSQPEPGSFLGGGGTFVMGDGTSVHGTNWLNAEYGWYSNLLETSNGSDWNERGQCDHCGSRSRYVLVMLHLPTGEHIAVGQDCAAERFEQPDRIAYLVKRAAQARLAAKELAASRALLAEFDAANPGVCEFFEAYGAEFRPDYGDSADKREPGNGFIFDVGRKLVKYGSISERQIAAVAKAFARDIERAAEVEIIPTEPVPEGKIEFEAKVLSAKWVENDFGGCHKMLVQADAGWKVWVTVPAKLRDAGVEAGDRVALKATVERSHDDEYFGFGNRPTGTIIKAES